MKRRGEVTLITTIVIAVITSIISFYAEDEYKLTVSINDTLGMEIDSNNTKPAVIYIKKGE